MRVWEIRLVTNCESVITEAVAGIVFNHTQRIKTVYSCSPISTNMALRPSQSNRLHSETSSDYCVNKSEPFQCYQ